LKRIVALRIKLISILVLGFFLLTNLSATYAQSAKEKADSLREARTRATDSTKAARQHAADSLSTAREHIADSIKVARKHKTDSVQAARKVVTDSLLAIRKYRNSKRYKDSVAVTRGKKAKSVKAARQAKMDSLQEARHHVTDSIASARKTRTDSVRAVQKERSDSIAAIKKYKTSKRYADSVTLAKHERMDSIKTIQKFRRDSIATKRKHTMDSAKIARTHAMDSVKAVRNKRTDSLKLVRKAKTDSIAKKKELKDKLAKAKDKKKLDSQKLKLELKIKQKREAWSNKSMLKKRWSPVRKATQNSFTHYNYYYNANRKMEEAEANMQRAKKDNFDSLIGLYPYNPSRDSSLLASDMDSIIRKVSVGIQIHDPRVKWSNDMYLLLGEAYYYKGSFENASIAFRYIISSDEEAKKKQGAGDHGSYSRSKDEPSILDDEKSSMFSFLKHKSVHNEAVLWLARTYTQANQVENAEAILSLVEYDPKFPEDLKGRLAIEKAFAYLASDEQPEASEQLAIAVDDDNLPMWLRQRAAFLNGQLLQNMGQYAEAANSFQQVVDHYPKIDMDFYARKYIAYNKLAAGQDVAEAMVPLKKILNDGKYVSYYDQVYFLLGQLAAKAHKPEEAITYLKKSTATPKATKKQKAQSFAALGDVYYSTAQYTSARNAYDSAAKYSTSSSKDKAIAAALQKSAGLKEVSGPAQVIHDQDSLLALASMSRKEQQSVVRRYLRDLEKKREDSIAAAETAASATTVAETETDKGSDAGNWYFSNPALVSQGSADFKRKWGSRPLTDNWRRSSGLPLVSGGGRTGGEEENEEGGKGSENGLPSEESLIARIPNAPQQKELAVKVIQRAYIQLAKAYFKQLEDYNQAIHTLDTLDKRYPDHKQKEEELYLRYQIALKQNKLDKAQAYAQELLAKFPDSEYASILKPKTGGAKLVTDIGGEKIPAYFDKTYAMILDHQYTEALSRIEVAKKQVADPTYNKRFEVSEAMAYAGNGNFNMADTIISKFIKANPSDSLTGWAKEVQRYISEVRNGGKPSWYNDAVAASKKMEGKKGDVKTSPGLPKAPPPPPPPPPVFVNIPSAFAYHADSEHYCIIVLPGLDSRTGALKQAVKNFDSVKYAAANLNIIIDLLDMNQGILVVRKFADASQAKAYLADLQALPALSAYKAGELQLYVISAANYRKLYTDKNVLPYSGFYKSFYQ
jgi:tetratricopeptide (TPR) repeat protein